MPVGRVAQGHLRRVSYGAGHPPSSCCCSFLPLFSLTFSSLSSFVLFLLHGATDTEHSKKAKGT